METLISLLLKYHSDMRLQCFLNNSCLNIYGHYSMVSFKHLSLFINSNKTNLTIKKCRKNWYFQGKQLSNLGMVQLHFKHTYWLLFGLENLDVDRMSHQKDWWGPAILSDLSIISRLTRICLRTFLYHYIIITASYVCPMPEKKKVRAVKH